MKEVWTFIKGYNKNYSVSNLGRIRSNERKTPDGRTIFEKVLLTRVSKDGYIRVKLYQNSKQKTFYLHRIVANHFLGNSNLDVNHIDGDKENNQIDNLEFVTRSENLKHAYDIGLKKVSNYQKLRTRNNLKSTHINNQKKVRNLNTGDIYESIKEAHKKTKSKHDISYFSFKLRNQKIKNLQIIK
jgi:hypothetical protein